MTPLDAWLRLWSGPLAGPAGGVAGATDAFQRFASEYTRLAGAPGTAAADWERLARDFTATLLPGGPAGLSPTAQRGAAATARIAAETARGFAQRLAAEGGPTTLRATFDAWVDAAEQAFRREAFGADFTSAQAALCDELVRARAGQQGWVDDAARAVGLPTRGEVDALHDTVRELRRQLDQAAPAPRRGRRP